MKRMQTATMSSGIAENMASESLANLENMVSQAKPRVAIVGEMECNGNQNSKLITLSLTNNAIVDVTLVFGTPLAVTDEASSIPANAQISESYLIHLASIVDNQGAGANFMQELNKRFLRNPIYCDGIQVITPNNALGISQRSEQINRVTVPYNSATDNTNISGAFIPQFTEYTAVNVLTTGILLGDFAGFTYKLLIGSTVRINFYINAINSPCFGY